jgi:hypothetical protein
MRNLLLIAVLICSQVIYSQAPQKMSYQAVVRNSNNTLVKNSSVSMRVSIVQSSPTGTTVFSETHVTNTNVNGLLTIEIGTGAIISGSFSGLDWAFGPYFLKTETDPLGGTNYIITGTSQLLSVPYALYAENTGKKFVAGNGINIKGDTIVNSSPEVPQTLTLVGDTLTISNGNSVSLKNSSSSTNQNLLRQVIQTGFITEMQSINCVTSSTDGKVLIVALEPLSNNPYGAILRFEKDNSGNYHSTHFLEPIDFEVLSMTVISNFIYLSFYDNNNKITGIKRVNLDNLEGLIDMTFNPSKPSNIGTLSNDGSNLLIETGSGGINLWRVYNIISTALINTTSFQFVYLGTPNAIGKAFCYFDGSHYYLSYFNSPNHIILKYDKAKNFVSSVPNPFSTQDPFRLMISGFSTDYLLKCELFINAAFSSGLSSTPAKSPVIVTTTFSKP